jgi:hypothetical protein
LDIVISFPRRRYRAVNFDGVWSGVAEFRPVSPLTAARWRAIFLYILIDQQIPTKATFSRGKVSRGYRRGSQSTHPYNLIVPEIPKKVAGRANLSCGLIG